MTRTEAVAIVGVAVVLAGGLGFKASEMSAERRERIRYRSRLPDVQLADLEGGRIELGRSPDRGTLLVFFTTSCGYCRVQLAALTRRSRELRGIDVTLISAEDAGRLRGFVKSSGIDRVPLSRVIRDADGVLARRLGIRRVPTLLAYRPDGGLAGWFEGATSIDTLITAVDTRP